MVDYVMDDMAPIWGIDEVFVVNNGQFVVNYSQWFEIY
jgi:hypothetical protein